MAREAASKSPELAISAFLPSSSTTEKKEMDKKRGIDEEVVEGKEKEWIEEKKEGEGEEKV